MNNITKRILISVISLVSVFIFPWYLLIAFGIVMILFVPLYLEFLVVGYWLDVLYGLPGENTMFLTFLVIFLVVIYIKKNLLLK